MFNGIVLQCETESLLCSSVIIHRDDWNLKDAKKSKELLLVQQIVICNDISTIHEI